MSKRVAAIACPCRVYVVDDDEAVRAAMSMLMQVSGWDPVPCASAEEFLSCYKPGSGQCMILDLRMPGLSGTELQARLRLQGDPLPVIIVSAHHDVPEAHKAKADGALAVLSKPFDHDELLRWVSVALQSQ